MAKTIETFIFIHDQDILLECESQGRFKDVGKYTYVFLGGRGVDKLLDVENIIVARTLPYNIEQHKNMCAYSGWHLLYKNNLVNTAYVNLFEYDISLKKDFKKALLDKISHSFDFYSYHTLPLSDCFLSNIMWCEGLFKHYYKLQERVSIKAFRSNIKEWFPVSNVTMSKDFFYKYMEDNEELFDFLKTHPRAGHDLERNLSVYYILNDDVKGKCLADMISHGYLNSHGT